MELPRRVVRRAVSCEDLALAVQVDEKVKPVPLSEDEQRILKQIEEQFYEHDPAFAEKVSAPGLYRPAFRKARWSVLGLVGSLVALVLTLQVHFLLAFVCFAAMLVFAFFIEDSLRKVSRAGLNGVRTSVNQRRRAPGSSTGQ
jgi:hypothetical protein